MNEDMAATIFCFTPERVTLDELERRWRADAEEGIDHRADSYGSPFFARPTPALTPPTPCSIASVGSGLPTPPPTPPPPPERQPDCTNPHCPCRKELFAQRQQAGYYKSLHERARRREDALRAENELLKAKLRQREQQLFGRKSEATASAAAPPELPKGTSEASGNPASPTPQAPRPRGQQLGSKGHKRRDYSHLPVREEVLDLPEGQRQCSACGLPFVPFPGTEDTTVLEVEVRAHRRLCHRRRYRPACSCGCHPGIITAPAPPRVIPKSIMGVSIWVTVLLDKFHFYRPTYRLLADLSTHGLDLSLGTLTDGLQRLVPLFEPLYQKLIDRQQGQEHWHADETRWLVFIPYEDKVGHRWYLWAFCSKDVVVFVLSPWRSHDVPEDHLGPDAKGILNVDRYVAYKIMAQVKAGKIILAFCWAHVRRDFLEVARGWPKQEEWALEWVNRIGELYKRNKARLEVKDDPVAFATRDQEVRAWVRELAKNRDEELAKKDLHPARRKVLESLSEHWSGLTVFVDHPHVPMDNNRDERTLRGPVIGRKNYWGSGAEWSGELAVMMFSLFETLELNEINPRLWLTAYLNACAAAGGKAPANVEEWLPWQLSPQQRQEWSNKPEPVNSS
jgi:transposase